MNFFYKVTSEKYFYSLLALFALANLFNTLSDYLNAIPYIMDDYWYQSVGLNNSLGEIFRISLDTALSFGRPSMIIHVFLTAASFTSSVYLRYLTQVLPIILLIFISGAQLFRSTKNYSLFAAYISIIGLSTFFDDGHHLIGAFPTALPVGLSLCFLHLYLDTLKVRRELLFKVLRIFVFVLPFFIYEAFFVLNAFFLFCQILANRQEFSSTLKRNLPEIVSLLVFPIIHIASKKYVNIEYNGIKFSADFLAIFFSLFIFSTGFLKVSTFFKIFFFLTTIIFTLEKLKSVKWRLDIPEVQFALVWLIPPFVISLTEKYQHLALQGETIYVTTFISQIGYTGLYLLLLFNFSEKLRKLGVVFLCALMFFSWHDHSNETISNRKILFAEIEKKTMNLVISSPDCINENDLLKTIPRTKHCALLNTWQCERIARGIAFRKKLKLCTR